MYSVTSQLKVEFIASKTHCGKYGCTNVKRQTCHVYVPTRTFIPADACTNHILVVNLPMTGYCMQCVLFCQINLRVDPSTRFIVLLSILLRAESDVTVRPPLGLLLNPPLRVGRRFCQDGRSPLQSTLSWPSVLPRRTLIASIQVELAVGFTKTDAHHFNPRYCSKRTFEYVSI